jgi:uracil-DNA glycosylase
LGLWGRKVGGKGEKRENRKPWLIRRRSLFTNGRVTRPVDSLIDFLQAEQARGRSHIFLDDAARDGLRELYIRMRRPAVAPPPATPAAAPAVKQDAVVSGTGKAEQLAGLRKQAERWAPAMALGTLREKMVFATGNPDAAIMLVGEAPGYNEEKEGEPFVGPAGQKLNDILKAMGIKREDVYISNLVKFRPSLPKQTTNNRKPSPEEMAACLPLVMAEISVVQPKLIIALGGTAAEGLLGLEGTVGSMRGKWHEVSGIPARVTYHPSYLLQSGGSNDVKRALWEDMLAAMEKLGMPISDKQRGYFLPKA